MMTWKDGMGEGGREAQEGGDICLHIADSLCFTAETNTTLYSNYTPTENTSKLIYGSSHQQVTLFSKSVSSVAQSCLTLCNPMDCSMPDLPVHHQLPEFTHKLMSIELVMPSNHLIFYHPLLLPSIFPNR